MAALKFYYLYSPTAHQDAENIRELPLEEKLEYLEHRLRTLSYLSLDKNDPMMSPDMMFVLGTFDCEDSVAYVATVMRLLGIPHTVYVGKVAPELMPSGSSDKYHVWIVIDKFLFETTAPAVISDESIKLKYYPMYYVSFDGEKVQRGKV